MPVTVGAGGVCITCTVNEVLGLSQEPIIWLDHTVVMPGIVVFITGAVVLPVPPIADVYHSTVAPGKTPLTTNGTNGIPWQ